MLKRKPDQKGFTIIELLVVIVIIGILVALALPQLFAAQARGRDTDRKNDLKNIQQQLETYFNDNGEYPATLGALVPEYMDAVPTPPRTTDPTYESTFAPDSADGLAPFSTYVLTVELENENDPDTGAAGAADDATYQLDSVNQD
jgi:prepilin-type N-terminal cleavage/methylation domain-containing protein